jgi:hypothetical protein
VKEDTDLFIIDEVGKMELFSSSFFPAVLKVLESNIPVLASIPIPKSGRDIPGGMYVRLPVFICRKLSTCLQLVDMFHEFLSTVIALVKTERA